MSKVTEAAEAVEHLDEAVSRGIEHIPRENVDLSVIPPAEYRQPWDRQEGESEYLYSQFLYYRDLGPGRTVAATHKHFNGETKKVKSGKSAGSKQQGISYATSKKFNWKARALSWDNDQERQYQLARSEAIRDMVARHEEQVVEAIDALMVPVKALNEAMQDEDFVHSLSKTDAKKLVQMANQSARTIPSLMSAERLARGMPTEIVGGTIDHNHVVTIERDQIGEILEVLAGAGVLDVGDPDFETGEIVDAEVVDVHSVPADDH